MERSKKKKSSSVTLEHFLLHHPLWASVQCLLLLLLFCFSFCCFVCRSVSDRCTGNEHTNRRREKMLKNADNRIDFYYLLLRPILFVRTFFFFFSSFLSLHAAIHEASLCYSALASWNYIIMPSQRLPYGNGAVDGVRYRRRWLSSFSSSSRYTCFSWLWPWNDDGTRATASEPNETDNEREVRGGLG